MTRCLPYASIALLAFASAGRAEDFKPVTFPAEEAGYTWFRTPSDNIGCVYTPSTADPKPASGGDELTCDRAHPKYLRFTLQNDSIATMTPAEGEQGCCGGPYILDIGQSWQGGPFSCHNTAVGLTCERKDGHGFFISETKVKVY